MSFPRTPSLRGADNSTTNTTDLPSNVGRPLRLDIAEEGDWAALTDATAEPYDGVVMRKSQSVYRRSRKRPRSSLTPVNLVHCTPEGLPENIFRNLSPKLKTGRRVLAPGGWVAAYGAYLNDDGSFRSPADAKVSHCPHTAMLPCLWRWHDAMPLYHNAAMARWTPCPAALHSFSHTSDFTDASLTPSTSRACTRLSDCGHRRASLRWRRRGVSARSSGKTCRRATCGSCGRLRRWRSKRETRMHCLSISTGSSEHKTVACGSVVVMTEQGANASE